MNDTHRLLAEYVKNGSDSAFRNLVGRYIGLVYSAAVRLMSGDVHLANDVTQTVFLDLARKAPTLPSDVMLGGWLHRHTCYVASDLRRSERRRLSRERQAVEMNALEDHSGANLAQVAPILDEAINQLEADDRTAIMLRFFEQHDFRSVGEALGSNEGAARMRVNRALDKLQALLKHRGVALSAAALGSALATQAVTAAPVGMAATVAGTALTGAAAGGGAAAFLSFMNITKIGAISVIAVAAIATPVAIQQQSKLSKENESLRQQVGEVTQLKTESARLADLLAQAKKAQAAAVEQNGELLKLRSEVTALRGQKGELDKLRSENTRLRTQAAAAKTTQAAGPEEAERDACILTLRRIDGAKQQFALENGLTGTNYVTAEQIAGYLTKGAQTLPACPSGGTYTLKRVDEAPACSIPTHVIP